MSEISALFDPRPMPRIASVSVKRNFLVFVEWSAGPRKGTSELVDLSPLIQKFKLYAPLRDNRALFESVCLADDGETLEWADGEIDMAATSVENLASEQMTGQEFNDFLKRHCLTRQVAAAEFGRSLRAIQSYVKCEEPIPRVIVLACHGYEADKQSFFAYRYVINDSLKTGSDQYADIWSATFRPDQKKVRTSKSAA